VIGIVAALAILVVGGAIGAVVVSHAPRSKAMTGAIQIPATPPDTAAATSAPSPTPPADQVRLPPPDHIGTLVKLPDQSSVNDLVKSLSDAGVYPTLGVVYYDRANPRRAVRVFGGPRRGVFGALDADELFDTIMAPPGTTGIGPRQDVDPGPIGGAAACAKYTGAGPPATDCTWVGKDTLVTLILGGTSFDQGIAQMREVLQAVVITG
jgi:hypothetical protein